MLFRSEKASVEPLVSAPQSRKALSATTCVLVVEDNPINQLVVKSILEKRGFKTLLASDGLEALSVLDSEEVHLVLMDVNMPRMDGYQATKRIREREALSGGHLPIVAVTANALPGDRKKCLLSGMDDYVSKPIQSKHLVQCIDSLLSKADPQPAMVHPV